jgi:hypothetical protein
LETASDPGAFKYEGIISDVKLCQTAQDADAGVFPLLNIVFANDDEDEDDDDGTPESSTVNLLMDSDTSCDLEYKGGIAGEDAGAMRNVLRLLGLELAPAETPMYP